MLLIMAWLFWLWYDDEDRRKQAGVKDGNSIMHDVSTHAHSGDVTRGIAPREENTVSLETNKDKEENKFDEKNPQIVTEDVDSSVINFDESENIFDYHDEFPKSNNFVEEEDIIPVVESNNYESIENDFFEVENNDQLSIQSTIFNTNSMKNSNSKIQNVTLAPTQDLKDTPQTHPRVNEVGRSKINVKVVQSTKLTLKNETTPGRIHSIVVKANDSNTSSIRSLSPRLRIHSNNSVTDRHGKDETHNN